MREYGIDVSRYQGKINWEEVKNSGIKFVILKLGNIYDYDANYLDTSFETNYNECLRLGIPVGVYVYDYCNTSDTLIKGINWVIEELGNRALQLPIYLDVEDRDIQKETTEELTSHCNIFAEMISKANYRPGVYASLSWLRSELNPEQFDPRLSVWVAQYYNECTYENDFDIWQFSSSERVPGISGRVDANFMINDIINIEPTPEKPDDIYHDGIVNCIYDIQEWLNRHYGFRIAQDDILGPDTFKALVKAYQIELNVQFKANLKVDGIFGPATKNASINVRKTARGNITMIIQMALFIKKYNTPMTKYFDEKTYQAVLSFQKDENLFPDGVVGKDTFERLLK